MTDAPAVVRSGLPAPVARLVKDSVSPNTLRAYDSALKAFDASRNPEDDAGIAGYLGALDEAGKSPSTARTAVAALRFRARLADRPDPVGSVAERTLKGFSRAGRPDRGRGQAPALTIEDMAAIATATMRPRFLGRGVESEEQVQVRGPVDRAIVGLLFHGALRRSEVAALEVRDVEPTDNGAARVVIRQSKTNQSGDRVDVRIVKGSYARALLHIVAGRDGSESIFGLTGQAVGNRFSAAARAAGFTATAHSGRVSHASELMKAGASSTEVMLSEGWTTARMVTHYSARAADERGAVAKYL